VSKPKPNTDKEDEWKEILDEIDIEYLPIQYISQIIIKFHDGASWDIDIDDSRKKQTQEEIEDSLDAMFEEYEDKIHTIDFRLDLDRVKHDLGKRVYRFLKLNK
jgi:hypothetical protein